MIWWQAIVLGIVEGVTEFLPISSTFHLLFATKALGITETEFTKFFTVFIQAGAILPVLVLYFRELISNRKLWFKLAASFIPTGIIGFILNDVIENTFFTSNALMIGAFAVVGVLFIVIEALIRKRKVELKGTIAEMSWISAILIGAVQACAVLPGVSRAGAVIIGMMLMGFKREEAAKYSFMLGAPTIVAAAMFDVLDTGINVVHNVGEIEALVIGFIIAFFSSLFILQWFIGYVRKNSLQGFGVYRLLVSGLLVLFGMWRS